MMAIQKIERGHTHGLQVRVGQGPGQTRFLAYRKHGGKRKTRALAKVVEAELEAKYGKKALNPTGRLMKNNRSGISGIRFEWREGVRYSYLYLLVTYTSKKHRKSACAWSLNKHSLNDLIQRALALRTKHGAPALDFDKAKAILEPRYLALLHGDSQQKAVNL